MKHEHSLEVNLSPQLQETIEQTKARWQENKKPYLFGVGGVVLGFALSRVFSRPTINVEISIPKE